MWGCPVCTSLHPKAIAVYHGHPILRGCGDFLNGYEGISGYEDNRPNLSLMYFVTLDAKTGTLDRFAISPMEVWRFRLIRASNDDARSLAHVLPPEGRPFGSRAALGSEGELTLEWQ